MQSRGRLVPGVGQHQLQLHNEVSHCGFRGRPFSSDLQAAPCCSENKPLLFAHHKAADHGSFQRFNAVVAGSYSSGPVTTEGTVAFGFQRKRAAMLPTRARVLTRVYHSVGDGLSAWQAGASPNSPPKLASIRLQTEVSAILWQRKVTWPSVREARRFGF